ncbi:unnamed protein product [Effrenium voratum]|nr:unnamed protein product [Effrenium voratum]
MPDDVIAWTRAVRSAQSWQLALQLLEDAGRRRVQRDTILLNSFLACAKGGGAWRVALEQLRRFEAVPVSVSSYGAALASSPPWQRAVGLLRELQRQLRANLIAYSSGLSACTAAWPAASLLLQKLQGEHLEADVIAMNSAISASPWQRSLHLLAGLQLRPSIVSYGACIASCEWRASLDLLLKLDKRHLVPLNSAISCCGNASKWRSAQLLLSKSCSVVTLGACISAYEKGAQWLWALHCAELFARRRVPLNLIARNAATSACEKAAQWQRGAVLLLELEDLALETSLTSFHGAISACEKAKQWRHALHFFEEACTRLRGNVITFSSAISACQKAAQWERALLLVHAMPSETGNVVAYNAALAACELGQWEQALQLLDIARQVHVSPDDLSYESSMRAAANAEQWEVSVHLLAEMRQALISVTEVALNAAISACENGAQWRPVLALLADLKLADMEGDVMTCSGAISAFGKAWRWRRALEFSFEDVVTYSCIVGACARSSQWRPAVALFEAMAEEKLRPDARSGERSGANAECQALLSEMACK